MSNSRTPRNLATAPLVLAITWALASCGGGESPVETVFIPAQVTKIGATADSVNALVADSPASFVFSAIPELGLNKTTTLTLSAAPAGSLGPTLYSLKSVDGTSSNGYIRYGSCSFYDIITGSIYLFNPCDYVISSDFTILNKNSNKAVQVNFQLKLGLTTASTYNVLTGPFGVVKPVTVDSSGNVSINGKVIAKIAVGAATGGSGG